MDLSKISPLILALVAVLTVIVNAVGLYLQRRRDSVDETTKRWDAAGKIAKAAVDLNVPLEKRVLDLEKSGNQSRELIQSQTAQIENLQKNYDETRLELRAIRADREQLLARVVILQNENQIVKDNITVLCNENVSLKDELSQVRAESERQRLQFEAKQSEFQAENDKLHQEVAVLRTQLETMNHPAASVPCDDVDGEGKTE